MEEKIQKNDRRLTLRELLECVPDMTGVKLPTAKMLRENCEVFQIRENGLCQLVVYENGFFTYTDGNGITVQRVSQCRQSVEYKYADGCMVEIEQDVFMGEPYEIRLILEGERRLDRNTRLKNVGRLFSYDNMDMESVDLCDQTDFVNEWLEKEEYEERLNRLHRGIRNLTEKQRQILCLYYVGDKTQQEIADQFGCKKQTISEIILRARNRIKKKYFSVVPDKPENSGDKVKGNPKKKGRKKK